MKLAIVGTLLVLVTSVSLGAEFPDEAEKKAACSHALPDTSTHYEGCVLGLYQAKLDAELNAAYAALLRRLAEEKNADARRRLVEAERAWITFRDKTCRYENEFGGINSIGNVRCFARLTQERMGYLKSQ